MDYIRAEANGQLSITQSDKFLKIPSCLHGFNNTMTSTSISCSGRTVFCFEGSLNASGEDIICPCCGARMHINNHPGITLRHLPVGGYLSCVKFQRNQYICPECRKSKMQFISFKAPGHMITEELSQYTRELLARGYTNKVVAEMTGLGKNTVKAIDKRRLQELYTVDGTELKKPEKPARFLGIDEFKLHNGHRYATHIIDMETGHILWIAGGKKKQVVYDFIQHVGIEWMDNVEAIACDMNSDFEEAFEEMCPHIQTVFDNFHIVKNFNDKVISEVRKDEQRRLMEEGDEAAAKALKKTRYY